MSDWIRLLQDCTKVLIILYLMQSVSRFYSVWSGSSILAQIPCFGRLEDINGLNQAFMFCVCVTNLIGCCRLAHTLLSLRNKRKAKCLETNAKFAYTDKAAYSQSIVSVVFQLQHSTVSIACISGQERLWSAGWSWPSLTACGQRRILLDAAIFIMADIFIYVYVIGLHFR